MIPGGSRPSSRAFSSAMISSRLVAFLILSCSLCFSLSVSFKRFILDPDVAAPLDVATLKAEDLMPMICIYRNPSVSGRPLLKREEGLTLEASSVGSSAVPNRSAAFSRSACLTFW